MKRFQHPPYWVDRAPSDFDLFPAIKEKLKAILLVDEAD
jgi:hypothetical protein